MKKKLHILLSTYNGSKYLNEQLDSLFSQTYKDFKVIARDDGSSDDTIDILKSYDINILDTKENLGAKGSFSTLLEYALKNCNAEYFMFCDQDDVWEKDKIEKTLFKMVQMTKEYGDIPLLVHTNLKVVNQTLKVISDSMWKYEHINPSLNTLNRLLMQNTVTGCTTMINRKLAQKSLPVSNQSVMHDWWIGLVASCFGKIGFIDDATINYRQHGANDTGAKKYNYTNILEKTWNMFFGKELYTKHLKKNISQAKVFFEVYKNELSDEQKEMLIDFSKIEDKSFFQRKKIILKYKLLKYGIIRNIGLFLKI